MPRKMARGGVWVHGSYMHQVDFKALKDKGITEVFLFQDAWNKEYRDILSKFLDNAIRHEIRVHAWFCVFRKHPEGIWISPTDENRIREIEKSIEEVLKYPGIGGIHLDGVRYPGEAFRIPNSTDIIANVFRRFYNFVKSINKDLLVSAALMPTETLIPIETGVRVVPSNAYHFGQDYAKIAPYVDVISPMAYRGNFNKPVVWIREVTEFAKSQSSGKEIWTGMYASRSRADPTPLHKNELEIDIMAAILGGATGYVLFNYLMIDRSFFDGKPIYLLED